MKINELLTAPGQPDKDSDLLKSRIVQHIDKILGKESSKLDREILQKKLSADFLEISNALEKMSKSELTELFQPGKNWQWTESGYDYAEAEFDVGDIPYIIRFAAGSSDPGSTWEVEFEVNTRKTKAVDSSKRHRITGTGNSAQVFSTVVDILRNFLSEYDTLVGSLEFSADEPNRRRLYSSMISRLLPDWKVSTNSQGRAFLVTRPELAGSEDLKESVNRVPLSDEDFDTFKDLMSRPIPAAVASAYIQEIIDDDELTDNLDILSEQQPARDVRPLIADWFKRVMPDQLYRFIGTGDYDSHGRFSPLHGYNTGSHKGTNDPVTGNAFGRI